MNKKINYLYIALIGIILSACGGPEGEKAETSDAKDVKSVEGEKTNFEINTTASIVEWKGTKPTGEHVGTVNITKGKILVQDGNIVAGKFTMDMASIVNKDLEDAEWNKKLVDHLKSPDFFNTAEFPQATFELTEIKEYSGEALEDGSMPTHSITGNLTIKGISKSITFPAMVKMSNTQISATTPEFLIDRTDWDIKYQSRKFFEDLKDKFIYDEIGLKLSIQTDLKR
ncbi:MAG: YceI family protein [Bacteroidales bacterium]